MILAVLDAAVIEAAPLAHPLRDSFPPARIRHQAQAKDSLCSRACDRQQAALLVVVGDTGSKVYRYVDYVRMHS